MLEVGKISYLNCSRTTFNELLLQLQQHKLSRYLISCQRSAIQSGNLIFLQGKKLKTAWRPEVRRTFVRTPTLGGHSPAPRCPHRSPDSCQGHMPSFCPHALGSAPRCLHTAKILALPMLRRIKHGSGKRGTTMCGKRVSS